MKPTEREVSPADTPTAWARTSAAVRIRAALQAVAVPLLSRSLTPLDVEGDLPKFPSPLPMGTIYVANHRSHTDSVVIMHVLGRRRRRRLVGAAAADYFFPNWYLGWCSALLLGAVPIDRTRISRRNLDECTALVAAGWSLLIFPEGGRNSEPGMQPFRAARPSSPNVRVPRWCPCTSPEPTPCWRRAPGCPIATGSASESARRSHSGPTRPPDGWPLGSSPRSPT